MENFTSEETERIIARAAKMNNKGGVSRMELLRIADQMGIDPATVQRAIEEEENESDKSDKKTREFKKLVSGFYYHLAAYGIIMAFLLFVDIASGPGLWIHWPMFAWGIGIAFHALPIVMKMAGFETEEDRK